MRLTELALYDRPRERLARLGSSALSDAELVAIILSRGTAQENVLNLAQRLLSTFTIDRLARCSLGELESFRGIGRTKACQLLACFELAQRKKSHKSNSLRCAKDVYTYCINNISNKEQEVFLVLVLDTKNCVVACKQVTQGLLNKALVHPREVFKYAVKENANSIILVHNHPSGDPSPSEEDKRVTAQLREAGEVLGITVLDHVILGEESWYSFADEHKKL